MKIAKVKSETKTINEERKREMANKNNKKKTLKNIDKT